MKIYQGSRTSSSSVVVTVREDDGPRRPLVHRIRHSTEFEWGYGGCGPADLALSILWDLLGETLAERLHENFKCAFIVPADREGFEITEGEIREWLGPALKYLRKLNKENLKK